MKNILSNYKNWLLLAFTLFSLVACGGGGGASASSNATNTSSPSTNNNTAIDNSACSQEFFNQNISNILTNCISCHAKDGIAKGTKLIFTSPLADNMQSNFNSLKSYIMQTDDKVVQKASKKIAHAGGVQLTGADIITMQNFVNYVKERQSCVKVENKATAVNSESISLLSFKDTLPSASFKLTSSIPSQSDLDKVSSSESLDIVLDKYMKSEYFYTWLHQIFNDFLLTDFYAPYRMAEDLLNREDFPNVRWYDDANLRGVNGFDDTERREIYQNVNYAIAREATQLMIHVIKEERPFSQILTADYVLVNPYSARSYGIDIDGFTFKDSDANLSIDEINSKYPKNSFREAKIPHAKGENGFLPSAGILTTITYLNRFPSTNTNLDRHRSSKTQLFFLDTNILELATRPITSADNIDDTATWTNESCTVCHNVMEPIASSFKNFDNRGRYIPKFRKSAVQAPGISILKKTPTSENKHLLQWLSKEMVKDDKFAMASVKLFAKALLGRDPLKKPSLDHIDYTKALQAYNYENNILTQIKDKFKSSNMNAKVIIKELIKSPLFRANAINIDNKILAKNIGQAKLISPEELNIKIKKLLGIYWTGYRTESYKRNNESRRHKLLQEDYRLLYGGINSNSVTKRNTQLNGVMANFQLRMATELSKVATSVDFSLEPSKRYLFPKVDKFTEPDTSDNITKIKQNIQYLHSHLLAENLAIDDAEIDATYKLFYDTYIEGKQSIKNQEESAYINGSWDIKNNLNTGVYEKDRSKHISEDRYYTMRSWAVVIAYMLSDFKFLYENSTN